MRNLQPGDWIQIHAEGSILALCVVGATAERVVAFPRYADEHSVASYSSADLWILKTTYLGRGKRHWPRWLFWLPFGPPVFSGERIAHRIDEKTGCGVIGVASADEATDDDLVSGAELLGEYKSTVEMVHDDAGEVVGLKAAPPE